MDNRVIFASGTKGNHVRANGAGGTLARGYYVRANNRLIGPIARKRDATAQLKWFFNGRTPDGMESKND
jgi:hypothetical protein